MTEAPRYDDDGPAYLDAIVEQVLKEGETKEVEEN